MVFNILCSNNDDHLRNHGFCGWPRLAIVSAYDVVSFPQVGTERDLGLSEWGAVGDARRLKTQLTDIASFGLSRSEGISIAEAMQQTVKAKLETTLRTERVHKTRNRRFEPVHRLAMRKSMT